MVKLSRIEKREGNILASELLFCCPKCGGALTELGAFAKCPLGHSFDKSKYGYYNLLLSNASGTHGDNKEMVLARRAFLGAGYYEPLAKRLSEIAVSLTDPSGALLDVGCGEGYYTVRLAEALKARNNLTRVAAFDISRDAVRELLRKEKSISAAVASAYAVPVSDGAFSTVVNAFSPFSREETVRALASGGHFIMAIPERDHLFELKEILYETPYKNEVKDSGIEGLTLAHDERLTYKMELGSREDIEALFKMTPYAYRTPRSAAERLSEYTSLTVTADFHIYVYRKD